MQDYVKDHVNFQEAMNLIKYVKNYCWIDIEHSVSLTRITVYG